MKNSRVWDVTHTVLEYGASVTKALGTVLALDVSKALEAARKNWPHAGVIKVKVVPTGLSRDRSVDEAKRRGTYYEVAKKSQLELRKLYDSEVVVVGGLVVRNRFGAIERDLLRL